MATECAKNPGLCVHAPRLLGDVLLHVVPAIPTSVRSLRPFGIRQEALEQLLTPAFREAIHLRRRDVVVAGSGPIIYGLYGFPGHFDAVCRRVAFPSLHSLEGVVAVHGEEEGRIQGYLALDLVEAGRAGVLEPPIGSVTSKQLGHSEANNLLGT